MAEKKVNLDDLRNTLPAMLTRKEVTVYLGGLFSVSYLANLNYKGIGPKPTKLGRKVVYLRDDLIKWLEERIQD